MKVKFLSAYSSFFVRIRRMRGEYLRAHGEYQEVLKRFRRIRGKYLSVHGEDGEARVICSIQNRLEYAERI